MVILNHLIIKMVKIGRLDYRLFLIDTCVISEILKNKEEIAKKIVPKFISERIIFCYTIQTIGELRKAPDIYDEFFKYMSVMPTVILKNYNQLTDEEIKSYPAKNKAEPILIFVDLCKEPSYYKEFKNLFERKQLKKFFEEEDSDTQSTLESLLNWKEGYKPNRNKYTKKEIEDWVELVTLKQIVINHPSFTQKMVNLKKGIEYKNFLSWNIIAFVIFYKFYISKRNSKLNDINDILNICALPYLDGIVTEKNLCEHLRQIKSRHSIIANVELYTINSFINNYNTDK